MMAAPFQLFFLEENAFAASVHLTRVTRRDASSMFHPKLDAAELTKQEAVLKATAVQSPLPVMSLILPCLPCLAQGGGLRVGVEGSWARGFRGRGVWRGRGEQGTFHPPCHVLHYHMVLCPKGTSHNQRIIFGMFSLSVSFVDKLKYHVFKTGSRFKNNNLHNLASNKGNSSGRDTCSHSVAGGVDY